MNKRQILGFAGAGLLAIGVFAPLISIPIAGSINYFNNGSGDGVIVLVLAIISAFLVAIRRYRVLWVTGLACLGLIGFSFMNISSSLAEFEREMADNPFRGLANVQMQWGWMVLVTGAVLLLAAAASKGAAPQQPPAQHPTEVARPTVPSGHTGAQEQSSSMEPTTRSIDS